MNSKDFYRRSSNKKEKCTTPANSLYKYLTSRETVIHQFANHRDYLVVLVLSYHHQLNPLLSIEVP